MTKNKFSSLNLKSELVSSLAKEGYEYLASVQQKTIPLLLKSNALVVSPTGSGKTLAYVVPILNDLVVDEKVKAIIISPTVPLLNQIKSVLFNLFDDLNIDRSNLKLVLSKKDLTRSSPSIVLTTIAMYPLILSKYPTDKLQRVIIDEGDMILFDGFDEFIPYLKKAIDNSLVSIFSASLKEQDIKNIKKVFHIENVIFDREKITASNVSHHLVLNRVNDLSLGLKIFLDSLKPYKTMIFSSSKDSINEIYHSMKKYYPESLLLTGDLDKRKIKNVAKEFSTSSILFSSDYASRGLDFKDVDCVISLDLPKDSSYYFHRAGRTGRFENKGDSYIFYKEDDKDQINRIKELIKRGVSFDSYLLNKDGLKEEKEKYEFRNLGKKDQSNPKLQKQIRHAINKVKTKKVKPNYKKKVRKAVEIVKTKHRKKVVLTNIAKKGGNVKDYHED